MTLVIGTAGHIDHGKTTLLRALTGIDADRLPEERRRGMTIDVGYAHMTLDDGRTVDFVDVPGHDRLIGNMLVGAGEIDAALLVVAADDGPRAQTLEHVALLDALAVSPGVAAITKIDLVDPERVSVVGGLVRGLLAGTSLAGSPIVEVSGVDAIGVDRLRAAIAALAGKPAATMPPSLAIDRVFSIRGRGTVVTGTLRGGPVARGDVMRLVPGETSLRIREIQVHGAAVDRVEDGGRTALNVTGAATDALHRGQVLTADPEVVASDRLLVRFAGPVDDRLRGRVHLRTAAVDATVGRSGRDALTLDDGATAGILRLAVPIAVRAGDRFVLRRSEGHPPVGGVVLDVAPARGVSRRRQIPERVASLLVDPSARLALHGALTAGREVRLAPDVAAAAAEAAFATAGRGEAIPLVRSRTAAAIRTSATLRRDDAARAATAVVDELLGAGRLVRDGALIRTRDAAPSQPAAPDPELAAAMDRLETALAIVAPPPVSEAARASGCPPSGVSALERAGRIVVLAPDLAYAASTYNELTDRALQLASAQPLTPAGLRDATGTSRKYVMAILEDLDRRAILRRTPDGHVPGPKAATRRTT